MRLIRSIAVATSLTCGCTGDGGSGDSGAIPVDLATQIDSGAAEDGAVPSRDGSEPVAMSAIKHLVVVVQENHSFDSYFGTFCTAPTGSNPTCNLGPACCEAAPGSNPGSDLPPIGLDNTTNAAFDPNHTQSCETSEINGGKMDSYVTATPLLTCGNPANFAYASSQVAPYRQWASGGALADRYFQPVTGQSASNLVYFGSARFLFVDNSVEPNAIGAKCPLNNVGRTVTLFSNPSMGDLLNRAGVSWAWYAEGYAAAKTAADGCSAAPSDCPIPVQGLNPCIYDPASVAPAFFGSTVDNPVVMRDLGQLFTDLSSGTLPSVVFVRGLTYHSEHPGYGITISAGTDFVGRVRDAVNSSPAASSTLLLVTFDESGGYFDHVSPPSASPVDGQSYGPRVPLLALGPFAKTNFVSHVQLEHSSVVRFIEWNWLNGATGQLGGRDAVVNNLGSLLDPQATGVTVP